MRGVIRRTGRAVALVAVLTVLIAHDARAADRDGFHRRFVEQLKRAKHWVVTVFDQIGLPPG